ELPAGDGAALGAGNRRRHTVDLHPRRRRLRQRPVPRRRRQPDDRQRDPVALPEPGRLSLGGGALLRIDGADHDLRRDLHPLRRVRGADGGGGQIVSGAMRWLRGHAVNIVAALVVLYLLTPIVVIFIFSFNNPTGRYNYTWVGFTFEHWAHAFSREELTE